jgi:hypothetical protein
MTLETVGMVADVSAAATGICSFVLTFIVFCDKR